jgi:ribosomal 50S subunit-recycling heat shock protein
MIQGGEVLVNSSIETRRRKKLKPGDEVQIHDDIFVVALAEPEANEQPEDVENASEQDQLGSEDP